jgi:hypothetical protein
LSSLTDEYDAPKIRHAVGRYTDFVAPGHGMGGQTHGVGWGMRQYHPGKRAGDLTDAGEVAIMLLEHLVEARGIYSFDGYAAYWQHQIMSGQYGSCNFMSVPQGDCPPGLNPGYINGASRQTLQNPHLQHLKGEDRKRAAANVNCLVAATHFLPLFFVESHESVLVEQAVSTVYLSHSNEQPVAAAEFLARALFRIIHHGEALENALHASAAVMNNPFITARLGDAVAKVREATDPSSDLFKHEFTDDVALTSLARLWVRINICFDLSFEVSFC